jgi:myo-inositol-1(or 4)-monophosphatase
VREAGGHVAFTRCAEPLGAPLDVEPHSPVVAARTAESLEALRRIPLS